MCRLRRMAATALTIEPIAATIASMQIDTLACAASSDVCLPRNDGPSRLRFGAVHCCGSWTRSPGDRVAGNR
jgi:hypothetical protein